MNLSKSKLIAFRQCPKRLWLEINRPELMQTSLETEAKFKAGYQVGAIAQSLYDPKNKGIFIDIKKEGFSVALERSKQLIQAEHPIFEAGFSGNGVLAFADVMLPTKVKGKHAWHMIEVKSSTSVKDYHRDDIAIQTYAAQATGFTLAKISLAHIDSKWVYPGDNQYAGLLKAEDLTKEALSRTKEVETWVSQAKTVLAGKEPKIEVGEHCSKPFDCGFYAYCTKDMVKAEYPIQWLPRIASKKVNAFAEQGIIDLREVPDNALNKAQLRVKTYTVENQVYFDNKATKKSLSAYKLPAYFLDFETISFTVPIWKGTRPYQQIPFQFSLHVLNKSKKLEHFEFLDLSGEDPSAGFVKALINYCGDKGPIFVYNAGFENTRISELAERFPKLKGPLKAISNRVVDLLPIARNHYYHPSQQGSWSIKKVLPAVVPELSYSDLDGVQDGGMAMEAFLEAIHYDTTDKRKDEIREQLIEYCKLDTYAMVRLWQVFAGRDDLVL